MRANRIPMILFILTLGLAALTPAPANAGEPSRAVSIDVLLPIAAPISRTTGEMAWIPLNVKYQHVLTDHLALMGKAGVNYSWAKGEKILEVNPMLALEWRPFHRGLRGFYLGPALLFSYCNYWNDYEVVDNLDHSHRLAIGVNLGWQFRVGRSLTIDLTFGLGYGRDSEVDRDGAAKINYSVDESIAGVYVGYTF